MHQTSQRAGMYVRQPQGYQAFMPKALPPEPPIEISDDLMELLLDAQRWLARLDGATRSIPDPGRFVHMYVRREAVLSSQIEGTQSTIFDLLISEGNLAGRHLPGDVKEVANYVQAMRFGLDLLTSLPVSVRLIREIHGVLLAGVAGPHLTPGALRRSQNWIGPPGSTLQNATFVPPPASVVPDALGDLERFIHTRDRIPLLVRLGLVHVQFEMIHPFLDGNGRVGRLLITLLLVDRGELREPVLYLSSYFRQHQQEYYARLRGVQEEGDWEGWLAYFLKGVAEAGKAAESTASQVQQLRDVHLRLVIDQLDRGVGNAALVLDTLFSKPIISVQEVRDLTGLTVAPANRLVGRLVDLGILIEITGQRRHRRFAYQPYIQLFDDPPPAQQALQ
ncbi:MAG: Fic family protein [Thermomicrobiales bacterium]